ncbi:MAG: RNA 2'-phosphotransferase [Flavobacteriaceae bacterium]|jgi:putative RNA 2'-phosphotransferase|nr:RNA 2'-phosphotransferase [Flavobacteriaceae bacterium]
MDEGKKKTIGKFLSLILRHEPSKIGVVLDENGWADVEELIQKCGKHRIVFSRKELDEIVETNNKQRYSFDETRTKIRANQGHSINIDLELQAVVPPEFLYHGTAERFLEAIKKEGIKKMSRQHVHLSQDKETAIAVGGRHGKVKVLTVLTGKMHKEGLIFFQSANGVWLTDFVSKEYISS